MSTAHGLVAAHPGNVAYAWFDRSATSWRVTPEPPPGLMEVPEIKLHTLRKVYSTYLTRRLAKRGIFAPKILQANLGHTRSDIATEIYNRVMEGDHDEALADPFGITGVEAVAGTETGADAKEEDEVL